MKMLFIMTSLKSGGIASSLVNLLKEISKNSTTNTQIDLLLFDTQELREDLPKTINVIKANHLAELVTVSFEELKKKSFVLYIVRILMVLWTKIFGDYLPYKIICATNKQPTEYDVAFSFTQSAPRKQIYGCCNEMVLYSVKAKQKIAFVHCDYVRYGINSKYSRYIYSLFDKIAVVSKSSKASFVSEVPGLANKTYTVFNCQDYERIIELSKRNPVQMKKDVVNISTIARIGAEKGHLRLIEVLKKLHENGKFFRWHVIGGGNSETLAQLKRKISEYHLTDNVILYGDQNNPYRIIKNTDALLLMSYHECAPMVFAESFTLDIPVLSTETLSAKELVSSLGYGMVCENSEQGLYDMLEKVINDPKCLLNYKEKIKRDFNATNNEALEQFWGMIND